MEFIVNINSENNKRVHQSIRVMNMKALLHNGTKVILILCMFSKLLCVLELLNRMQ